ncbi:MAG: hypothetical protein ACOVLC_09430 [Flavobacterium sp.]
MQKFLIYIYSLITTLGFSQVNKTEIDSTLFAETFYRNHFFTFGPLYNTTESLIGLQIGNGNNEQPLIHFEDLSADILYKISGQTDFNDNYSIDSEVSWNYPFKGKLSILSLNFNQSQFNDNQFFQRNIGLSSRYYLRFTSNLTVIAKLSHQRVNEQNNLGLGLGLQNGHQGIYYGIRVDYFDKYYNYSAYLQSLIFKSKLSIRLTHDRIDKYDYFNIGLNYVIIKTTANTM